MRLPLAFLSFLLLASPARAVLSVDVQTSGTNAADFAITASALTTANAGDIIVVITHAEWVTAAGAPGSVLSVSNSVTPLTWHKRSSVVMNGGAGTAHNDLEVWWAYSSGVLTSSIVTVTFNLPSSTNFDAATVMAVAVTGFTGTLYQTSPWDQNDSLPVTGTSTTSTTPSLSISTTNAATMGVGFIASASVSPTWGGGTVGSGYGIITSGQATGAVNHSTSGAERQVFSSTQTGTAVNWTSASTWLAIADALSQTGGAVAASSNLPLLGVGR